MHQVQLSEIEYCTMNKRRLLLYSKNPSTLLRKRATRMKTALTSVSRLHLTRGLLAIMGDRDLLNSNIEEETARLRLAILEPFLYYRLPLLDASLVHASVLEKDGYGIMFAGTGHVGKTSLALMLMKKGYSY